MALQIASILTESEIAYIFSLPEVVAAKGRLDAAPGERGSVYLNLALPAELKATLSARLGIDLSAVNTVPLRWIKGDSLPHVDRSAGGAFENTYLVYLSDSPGQLVLGDATYPIQQNTGYTFQEGLYHETVGAAGTSRLLIGPMNEFGVAVGSPIYYYPTQVDALNMTNLITTSGDWTLDIVNGFSSWRLAANSSGSSSQSVVYTAGQTLASDGVYYVYPANPCFLKGSKILCEVDGKEEWRAVETLRPGDRVKTSLDGYKKVELIGSSKMKNPGTSDRVEERLYRLKPAAYPDLKEDLYLTGAHSVLVDELTDAQRAETKKILGRIFVTDRKYRLMACVDERAEPWASEGEYEVWHFALEHTDIFMNYGVYANGGLLVESCSIRFMRDKSNMTLLS
jgi:hypothetical protein